MYCSEPGVPEPVVCSDNGTCSVSSCPVVCVVSVFCPETMGPLPLRGREAVIALPVYERTGVKLVLESS